MILDIPSFLLGKKTGGGGGGGGSSGEPESKAVDFYDVDGTRVYSYTEEEFNALTTLPTLPDHTDKGLVAQGWNWPNKNANTSSLEWMKEVLADSHALDIGAIYDTSHKGLKLVLDVYNPKELTVAIDLKATDTQSSGILHINWGDNSSIEDSTTISTNTNITFSHTYANTGVYIVDIYPENSSTTTFVLGHGGTLFGSVSNLNALQSGNKYLQELYVGSCCTDLASSTTISGIGYCMSLKFISLPMSSISTFNTVCFNSVYNLKYLAIPPSITILEGGGAVLPIYSTCSHICFPPTLVTARNGSLSDTFKYVKRLIYPGLTSAVAASRYFESTAAEKIYIAKNCSIDYSDSSNTSFISSDNVLESLDLSNLSITYLRACSNLRNLKYMILPAGSYTIAASTFGANYSCVYYYFKGTTPPTLLSSSVFQNHNTKTGGFNIVVPDGCGDTYKTSTNWSSFASYIVEYSDYFGS